MGDKKTIIRVRKGILGKTRYSACDKDGNFIYGFHKLLDIHKHWKKEIEWGRVELIRELDKIPDMEKMSETEKCLATVLKAYAR